jgi:hypothetical protein
MPLEESRALAGLGRCEQASANTDSALILLRQALEIVRRTGAADAPAIAAELAHISTDAGVPKKAAEYERVAPTTLSGDEH